MARNSKTDRLHSASEAVVLVATSEIEARLDSVYLPELAENIVRSGSSRSGSH